MRTAGASLGTRVRVEKYTEKRPPGGPAICVEFSARWLLCPNLRSEGVRHRTRESPDNELVHYPDTIVGRAGFFETLQAALTRARLVSVVAPGGMGKTTIARAYGDSRPSTVVAELADCTNADQVCRAVAAQLNVVLERSAGAQHLVSRTGKCLRRSQTELLILDNAEEHTEHLREMVPQWMDLAPDTTIFLTSRRRLELPNELTLELPPLDVPPANACVPDEVRASHAVRMFELCAQRIRYNFEVTPENVAAVTDIVRQLDGIPLAIELAAGRLDVLTPLQLASAVSQSLDVVSNPVGGAHRQATLRRVVEDTWRSLTPWERDGAMQLAIFRGGFTAAEAEAVLDSSAHADAPDVVTLLQALRRKSIVHEIPNSDAETLRFDQYQLLQRYGSECLTQHDMHDAVALRHARLFRERSATGALHAEDGPNSTLR